MTERETCKRFFVVSTLGLSLQNFHSTFTRRGAGVLA